MMILTITNRPDGKPFLFAKTEENESVFIHENAIYANPAMVSQLQAGHLLEAVEIEQSAKGLRVSYCAPVLDLQRNLCEVIPDETIIDSVEWFALDYKTNHGEYYVARDRELISYPLDYQDKKKLAELASLSIAVSRSAKARYKDVSEAVPYTIRKWAKQRLANLDNEVLKKLEEQLEVVFSHHFVRLRDERISEVFGLIAEKCQWARRNLIINDNQVDCYVLISRGDTFYTAPIDVGYGEKADPAWKKQMPYAVVHSDGETYTEYAELYAAIPVKRIDETNPLHLKVLQLCENL